MQSICLAADGKVLNVLRIDNDVVHTAEFNAEQHALLLMVLDGARKLSLQPKQKVA